METTNVLSGKKILIVDDEQMLRDAVAGALRENSCTVLTAGDGEEGLQKALDEHPDLILLDIMMPKTDGIAMLKELRTKQSPPTSQVIFFTNLSDMAKIAEALNEGAAGYIVKAESSLDGIVEKIKEAFGKAVAGQ